MTSHFDSTRQPGRPEGKPQIDTDIPIPKKHHLSKYQWVTELEVGHSFVIEESKRYQPERIAKLNGMKLQGTCVGQEPGMLRMWRVI